jgi:hypothetical protein
VLSSRPELLHLASRRTKDAPCQPGAAGRSHARSLRRPFPVRGEGGAGELLIHEVGEQQQRASRPVVHHDIVHHPVGVAANDDDNPAGPAVNLSGVVLKKAIVAAGTDVVEVLVLIQRLVAFRLSGENRTQFSRRPGGSFHAEKASPTPPAPRSVMGRPANSVGAFVFVSRYRWKGTRPFVRGRWRRGQYVST